MCIGCDEYYEFKQAKSGRWWARNRVFGDQTWSGPWDTLQIAKRSIHLVWNVD